MEDITKTGALTYRELRDQIEAENRFKNNIVRTDAPSKEDALETALSARWFDVPVKDAQLLSSGVDYTQELLDAGYGDSRFDRSITSVSELSQIEEHRARQQSYVGQLTNGVLKGGVIAVTTFVDNFLGTLAGIANLGIQAVSGNIHNGSETLSAFVDNPFSVLMQKINEKSEEWLPNYYTEEEQNSPWYLNLWRANFIGDHFLKNAGFMVGTAASAVVSGNIYTGVLSKTSKLANARNIFRGTALAMGAPEAKTAKEVLNAYKGGKAILNEKNLVESVKGAARTYKNYPLGMKLAAGVSGSFGESRIEAISNSDYFFNRDKNLLDYRYKQDINNILPNMQKEHPELFTMVPVYDSEGQMIGARMVPKNSDDFNIEYNKRLEETRNKYNGAIGELTKYKIDYSNASFLVNLLLTSAENFVVVGDALTGGYKQAKKASNLARKKGEHFVKTNKYLMEYGKAAGVPIFEGTQEMFQQATTVGLDAWNAKKLNTYYGSSIDPNAVDATNTWLGTMMNALGNVYSDIDQWENFALGFLTALLPISSRGAPTITKNADGTVTETKGKWQVGGGVWDALREAKEVKEQTSGVVKALNDFIDDPDKQSLFYSFVRNQQAGEKKQNALDNDNVRAYKNAEFDKFINMAILYNEVGRPEEFIDQLEAAYTVTPEGVEDIRKLTTFKDGEASMFDNMSDEEVVEYFREKKEEAISTAKTIQDLYQSIDVLYGQNTSKEFKSELLYDIASIDNREKRIKQVTDEILALVNDKRQELKDTYGYDIVESLQNIRDLNVFIESGKLEELNDIVRKMEAAKQEEIEKLSHEMDILLGDTKEGKTEDEKTKKDYVKNALQGKVLRYAKEIKRLESKVADGTITDVEKKVLTSYKRWLTRYKNSLSKHRQAVKDLQNYLDETSTQPIPETLQITKNLEDLVLLLVDREFLITRFEMISEKPELFQNLLSTDVSNAIDVYKNKIAERVFDEFSKERNRALLTQNEIDLPDIRRMAEEKNREDIIAYIDSYYKYMRPLLKTNSRFDLSEGNVNRFAGKIEGILAHITSEEEAEEEINKFIENMLQIPQWAELAKLYKSELNIFKRTEEGLKSESDENTSEESEETEEDDNITITPKMKKFSNIKDLDEVLADKDLEELNDFITEYELDEYIDSYLSDEEVDREDLSEDAMSNILIQIQKELQDRIKENPSIVKDSKKSKSKNKNYVEEDEEDEDDDEGNFVEEEILDDPSLLAASNVDTNTIDKKGTKKSDGKDKIEVDLDVETKGSKNGKYAKYKDGNSEQQNPVGEDAFSVNRVGAKYDITRSKNSRKREAVESRKHWARKILNYWEAQEFIDGGHLAKLKQEAEKNGGKLKIYFTQYRGDNFTEPTEEIDTDIAQKNAKRANTIFAAVEVAKTEYENWRLSKHGRPIRHFNKAGESKILLPLGVVSVSEQTDPQTKKRFSALLKEVKRQTSNIKASKNGKASAFTFATIASDVEMIFSGRIITSIGEDGELQERDLLSIFNKAELDAQLGNGTTQKDQLQIVVKRSYDSSEDTVIGDNLRGDVVELNPHRQGSYIIGGVVAKPDRSGTVWIRTKEPDGKIYHKGVKVVRFNEDYKEDDSPIARRIRAHIKRLVNGNANTYAESIAWLKTYLYIPKKKGFNIDIKSRCIRQGELMIPFDTETAVDDIYNFLKKQGFRFNIGNDPNLTVTDYLKSKVLYTDLASLHNVNASFLISQVDVRESEDKTIITRPIPSEYVKNMKERHLIHTGNTEYQKERGRAFVTLGEEEYEVRDEGVYRRHGTITGERITDPYTIFKIKCIQKIQDPYVQLEPIFRIQANKKLHTKRYSVYAFEDGTTRNMLYITSDGIILSEKDVEDLRTVAKKDTDTEDNTKDGEAGTDEKKDTRRKRALQRLQHLTIRKGNIKINPEVYKASFTEFKERFKDKTNTFEEYLADYYKDSEGNLMLEDEETEAMLLSLFKFAESLGLIKEDLETPEHPDRNYFRNRITELENLGVASPYDVVGITAMLFKEQNPKKASKAPTAPAATPKEEKKPREEKKPEKRGKKSNRDSGVSTPPSRAKVPGVKGGKTKSLSNFDRSIDSLVQEAKLDREVGNSIRALFTENKEVRTPREMFDRIRNMRIDVRAKEVFSKMTTQGKLKFIKEHIDCIL